jgi:hypothetical protein
LLFKSITSNNNYSEKFGREKERREREKGEGRREKRKERN